MTRPHCRAPDACVAKTNRHCSRCRFIAMRNDPAMEARRAERWRQKLAEPEFRAEHVRRSQVNLAKWRDTPEGRAIVRERALTNLAKANTPEGKADRKAKTRALRLAWCPVERRDEYVALARRMPAAEARAVIEADERVRARRAIRAIDRRQRDRRARERAQLY